MAGQWVPRGSFIGPTPNITATATASAPGTPATVTKSGTPEAPVLEFVLPRGNDGQDGSNVLPTDTAIEQAMTTPGTATNTALSATIVGEVDAKAIPKGKDANDTFADVTRRLQFTDAAGAKGSQFNFEHWADGSGRTGTGAGQTYAIDIHNNPGARSALMIHQYSNNTPMVQLDNTDTAPTIIIRQTNNPVRNPNSATGTAATGDAILQTDYQGAPWWRLDGRGSIIANPPADATQNAIDVNGNSASTKRLIKLTGKGAAPALEIIHQASNQYGMQIAGQNYGASISVSVAGGHGMRITRTNATGTGDGLDIRVDSATSRPLLIRSGTTEVAQINASGEYEHKTAGAGIILKAPGGVRYRITVADGGAVTAVAA